MHTTDDDSSARIAAAGRAWARERAAHDGQASRLRRRRHWLGGLAATGLAAASLALLGAGGTGAAPHNPDRFDRVVIDAGHGGDDEGAKGHGGLTEKELVLDVSRRVARGLEAAGIEVLLTRSDDTFVPLEERTSRANDARADLFVSIHANASRNRKPVGVETYFVSLDASDDDAAEVASRENEVFGEAAKKVVEDDPLAQLLGDMMANEFVRESSEFAKIV